MLYRRRVYQPDPFGFEIPSRPVGEGGLIDSAERSFFYVKCHCHNDITKGSVAVPWTARRDKLVGVLSLSWKVFFELYKLLFL